MTPQNKPKCTCEIFWDVGKWKGRKLSKTCPIHKKDALIPDLFHGPVLTFWEAVGLLVLSHILFRGWGRPSFSRHRSHWKKRFEEKLASMTPEEQEQFKREWKNRCGWYPGMHEEANKQSAPGTASEG